MSSLRPPVSERDHLAGDPAAPVVLVEYGDYECPYCGAAYPVVKRLQRHFGERMCFVFRNFPLTESHPHAEHAAEAAEAAGAAGRFWEMHDAIFEHQSALDDPHLVRYGEGIGVSGSVIEEALETERFAAHIRQDFLSGVRSGVNGTPTFFINGQRYDGDYDVTSLTSALEDTTTIRASDR
jgi:protein-disulfide isomerase